MPISTSGATKLFLRRCVFLNLLFSAPIPKDPDRQWQGGLRGANLEQCLLAQSHYRQTVCTCDRRLGSFIVSYSFLRNNGDLYCSLEHTTLKPPKPSQVFLPPH